MQKQLEATGQKPTALCNNCSGKHAGMLLYCRHQQLPLETYLAFDHPLQLEILSVLQKYGDITEIPRAIDGCGAPVFYLPLQTMALLYARLGIEEVFQPIVKAMTTHPVIVGGEGRIDTVIMQASEGRLLAKVGADGLICVSRVGQGEGLTLKMMDGSNEARNAVIIPLLKQLDWLTPEQSENPALQPYLKVARLNTQNKVIGYLEAQLPAGDA
jgi:L-asparaginase II